MAYPRYKNIPPQKKQTYSTQPTAATAVHFVELAPRVTTWHLTTKEGGECYQNSIALRNFREFLPRSLPIHLAFALAAQALTYSYSQLPEVQACNNDIPK